MSLNKSLGSSTLTIITVQIRHLLDKTFHNLSTTKRIVDRRTELPIEKLSKIAKHPDGLSIVLLKRIKLR